MIILSGFALADQRPRVFITDSQSWEVVGSAAGSGGAFAASTRGGARPQTAEIIKTFGERCQEVLINNKPDKADYVVVLDHEGGKGYLQRRNKVAVFNKDGDAIVSRSTRSLGNSVQDACGAIVSDWSSHASGSLPTRATSINSPEPVVAASPANSVQSPMTVVAAPTPTAPSAATLEISSAPAGADIEIDGGFSGSTPSSVGVGPGDHNVRISKKGYIAWERKVRSSNGNIRIIAELEAGTVPAAIVSSSAMASNAGSTAASPQAEPLVATTAAPATSTTLVTPVSAPVVHPAAMKSLPAQPAPVPATTPKPETIASPAPLPSTEGEGTASVTSNLDRAEIFVDSVGRGFAPALLKLKPGKHRIQLVANGYKDWVSEIEVRDGSIVNVTGNLEK